MPTRRPSASNGLAPTDSGAAASAELTRHLTEDHDRIVQGINDVMVRRIFAAGLDLQAALELIGEHGAANEHSEHSGQGAASEHGAASKIRHAIGELDQAVRDIRDTIFNCTRATRGPDANGTRG